MKNYKNKKEFKEKLYDLSAVEIYKEVLKGNYIKTFPKGFWQQPEALSNAKKITKYLIENILKWSDKDIREKLLITIFKKYKLQGMMHELFNNSIYKAVNLVYPDRFKPWEVTRVAKGFWNNENSKEAIKWLIEEKLKLDDKGILSLNNKLFKKYNLGGLILKKFNGSIYKAINLVYPDRFKPWEFKQTSRHYWNSTTAKAATKWLIKEKLKLNDNGIRYLNKEIFVKYGLDGMLQIIFNNSIYKAVNSVYPGKFKLWELRKVSTNYWNKKSAKEATKWLIEEKLRYSEDEIINNIKKLDFYKYGLSGMLFTLFDGSMKKAINNAYPKIYDK